MNTFVTFNIVTFMCILEYLDSADPMTQTKERLYPPLKHHPALLAVKFSHSCLTVPIMFILSKKILTLHLHSQPSNHYNAEMNNIQVHSPVQFL